jgi:hypothetical protein
MGDRRGSCMVFVGNLRGRDHLENLDINGIILLKLISKKWDGAWTGLIWLRLETGGGFCECGNEPSVSIKCGEFLDS